MIFFQQFPLQTTLLVHVVFKKNLRIENKAYMATKISMFSGIH